MQFHSTVSQSTVIPMNSHLLSIVEPESESMTIRSTEWSLPSKYIRPLSYVVRISSSGSPGIAFRRRRRVSQVLLSTMLHVVRTELVWHDLCDLPGNTICPTVAQFVETGGDICIDWITTKTVPWASTAAVNDRVKTSPGRIDWRNDCRFLFQSVRSSQSSSGSQNILAR